MQSGDEPGSATIELFRKRIVNRVRPKSGFDVAERNLAVERREGSCKRSRGVSLTHDQRRRLRFDELIDAFDGARGDAR